MTDPKYRGKEQMSSLLNKMEQDIQKNIDEFLNENQNIEMSSVQVTKLLIHINADLPQDYKDVLMARIERKFEGTKIVFKEISSSILGSDTVCNTYTIIEFDSYEEVDCE